MELFALKDELNNLTFVSTTEARFNQKLQDAYCNKKSMLPKQSGNQLTFEAFLGSRKKVKLTVEVINDN